MSLNVIGGSGQWTIEDNNEPDAYLRLVRRGQFVLDTVIVGGVWISRDRGQYLLDPAGQPDMAISHEVVTVSTSAVALNTASKSGATLFLKNTSGNAADLGASTVTAGTGFGLAASASLTVQLAPGDVLYAIRTASSDATIAVLRT